MASQWFDSIHWTATTAKNVYLFRTFFKRNGDIFLKIKKNDRQSKMFKKKKKATPRSTWQIHTHTKVFKSIRKKKTFPKPARC